MKLLRCMMVTIVLSFAMNCCRVFGLSFLLLHHENEGDDKSCIMNLMHDV
jgi:hypothetical protein